MRKDFDAWNTLKKKIHGRETEIFFHEPTVNEQITARAISEDRQPCPKIFSESINRNPPFGGLSGA